MELLKVNHAVYAIVQPWSGGLYTEKKITLWLKSDEFIFKFTDAQNSLNGN